MFARHLAILACISDVSSNFFIFSWASWNGQWNIRSHPPCWWSSLTIQAVWVSPQTSSCQPRMRAPPSMFQPRRWTMDCSQLCTRRWHSSRQLPRWHRASRTGRSVGPPRVFVGKSSLHSVPSLWAAQTRPSCRRLCRRPNPWTTNAPDLGHFSLEPDIRTDRRRPSTRGRSPQNRNPNPPAQWPRCRWKWTAPPMFRRHWAGFLGSSHLEARHKRVGGASAHCRLANWSVSWPESSNTCLQPWWLSPRACVSKFVPWRAGRLLFWMTWPNIARWPSIRSAAAVRSPGSARPKPHISSATSWLAKWPHRRPRWSFAPWLIAGRPLGGSDRIRDGCGFSCGCDWCVFPWTIDIAVKPEFEWKMWKVAMFQCVCNFHASSLSGSRFCGGNDLFASNGCFSKLRCCGVPFHPLVSATAWD